MKNNVTFLFWLLNSFFVPLKMIEIKQPMWGTYFSVKPLTIPAQGAITYTFFSIIVKGNSLYDFFFCQCSCETLNRKLRSHSCSYRCKHWAFGMGTLEIQPSYSNNKQQKTRSLSIRSIARLFPLPSLDTKLCHFYRVIRRRGCFTALQSKSYS